MPEIEQVAEGFLAQVPSYVWDGVSVPVPIEDIADSHVGLLVRDVDDLANALGAAELAGGQSLSGLLLPSLGEIWVHAVDSRDWPTRRRFTIAHELGHWVLHRDRERSVFCRAASVGYGDGEDEAATILIEREANTFAAAVLMPARLLREHYADYGRDFARLCETFGCSGSAMGRRLHTVIPRRR